MKTRFETIKNAGINTNNYFSLLVNNTIPAGSVINVSVDQNAVEGLRNFAPSETERIIMEDGYVRNSRIHRRWICAQYMRMLNFKWRYEEGWHACLKYRYSYMYQFEMMIEEVRVLSKLERKDRDTFYERSKFFTKERVISILESYADDVRMYLDDMCVKPKKYKGKPYITVKPLGWVLTDAIGDRIMTPIFGAIELCRRANSYSGLYNALFSFKAAMIELPYDHRKIKEWVNAFQLEGAYYTLRNLIMFHDVKLYYQCRFHDMDESMRILESIASHYEGYELNGLLKKTIKMNDFDFRKSIEAHR